MFRQSHQRLIKSLQRLIKSLQPGIKSLQRLIKSLQSLFSILCITILVTACQSRDPDRTPVREIGQGRSGAWHIVQRGETLYSIAWRYGLDYKELAALNGISPPYTIYIDQKIRLIGRGGEGSPKKRAEKDGPPRDVGKSRQVKKQAAKPESAASKSIESVQGDGKVAWRWPMDGEIAAGFSLNDDINKGLDIRGKPGDRVKAAGDGVVVYAGGGLRGYGKLVIVKHNDRFLSAYAHNRKVLVKEGDRVKGGETIGRIGNNGPDTEMLHFEIRLDGKPEDPLAYLPAR